MAEWKLLIGSSRRTLIHSKDPFSSPLDLFTLFSISSPSMKPTFSDMLLSICSESIITTEATELYSLMKKGGTFSFFGFFKYVAWVVGGFKTVSVNIGLVFGDSEVWYST